MKEEPFAMVGVNSWIHEPGELKKVMTKENINWRSFDDQSDINRQWNLPATPSYYVLDHTGVIRRKWIGNPGEKSIDAALLELIQSAAKASPPR